MGFGVVTAVACIVRTVLTYQIKKSDLSWVGVGLTMAKCLEVNLGIIAACLPLMKPLYTFIRSGQRPRRASSGAKSTTSGSLALWFGLWPSRTATTPGQEMSQPVHPQSHDTEHKRQFMWIKPLPSLPSMGLKKSEEDATQDTVASLGLPMQGIQKKTQFDVDEHRKSGLNPSPNSGVELEEFV